MRRLVNGLSVLIPVIGGLAVGLFNHYFLKEEKVHGTAAVMQSVALSGGRLPYQSAPAKAAAAALSLGSGASVGPEDPAVQIGANIASMFGQWLRLSDERVKILVAAGAGSAIAAAFNAPIAGVFFALELILGEISGNALWLILVSTVVSAVFTQAVSGNAPAFQVPAYQFHSAWELPLYLLLGMVVGPLSALYADLLYRFQDIYSAWHIADWIKPASAGLILGIAALFIPQVLGTGYSSIEEILNQNGFTLTFLLMLAVAKLNSDPAEPRKRIQGRRFCTIVIYWCGIRWGVWYSRGAYIPGAWDRSERICFGRHGSFPSRCGPRAANRGYFVI